jgi:hypothetical protein
MMLQAAFEYHRQYSGGMSFSDAIKLADICLRIHNGADNLVYLPDTINYVSSTDRINNLYVLSCMV